jgi:hypothetical protein
MWCEVRLFNVKGAYLDSILSLVTSSRPQILIWRSRQFAWSPEHKQYREALAIHAMPNMLREKLLEHGVKIPIVDDPQVMHDAQFGPMEG